MNLLLNSSLGRGASSGSGGGGLPTISGSDISLANLVHWWPFNGNGTDVSGNGRDAILGNNPGYTTGPAGSGQGVRFVQASQNDSVSADATVYDANEAGRGCSLALWLQPTDLSAHIVVGQKADVVGNGWAIFWNWSASHWVYRAVGTQNLNPSNSGADITLNQWDHFVITRANRTANPKVYRNAGTPVTLANTTAPGLNTDDFHFGRLFSTFWNGFDACEHSYWDRELSAAEVAVLYNGGVRVTLSV